MTNVVKKVVDDMRESTRAVHKINKENLTAEKAAAKKRHAEAVRPDPGLQKVKEAKGFKNKVKIIAENIKESAKENSEKEKARRAEIKSHSSYKKLLEEQREKRES